MGVLRSLVVSLLGEHTYTSFFGWIVFLAAVFNGAQATFDADPKTNINWENLMGAAAGVGLIQSADGRKVKNGTAENK